MSHAAEPVEPVTNGRAEHALEIIRLVDQAHGLGDIGRNRRRQDMDRYITAIQKRAAPVRENRRLDRGGEDGSVRVVAEPDEGASADAAMARAEDDIGSDQRAGASANPDNGVERIGVVSRALRSDRVVDHDTREDAFGGLGRSGSVGLDVDLSLGQHPAGGGVDNHLEVRRAGRQAEIGQGCGDLPRQDGFVTDTEPHLFSDGVDRLGQKPFGQIDGDILRNVHEAAAQRQILCRFIEDFRNRSIGVLDHNDTCAVKREFTDELLEYHRVRRSAFLLCDQLDARAVVLEVRGRLDAFQIRPSARFICVTQTAHPQAAGQHQSCHSQHRCSPSISGVNAISVCNPDARRFEHISCAGAHPYGKPVHGRPN